MKRIDQFELGEVGMAFNLYGQTGDDPVRVHRERDEALASARAAEEYQARMQRSLAECPGFITCDAPKSGRAEGIVTVEPGRLMEAWSWLRKRYHVCETVDLDRQIEGAAIKIKARAKTVNGQRASVKFHKPEQFRLAI